MNLLEHYIKEIHSVEECKEEWTKEFPGEKFVNVDLTYDCYGRVERRIHCWKESYWEQIMKKGYFMG